MTSSGKGKEHHKSVRAENREPKFAQSQQSSVLCSLVFQRHMLMNSKDNFIVLGENHLSDIPMFKEMYLLMLHMSFNPQILVCDECNVVLHP